MSFTTFENNDALHARYLTSLNLKERNFFSLNKRNKPKSLNLEFYLNLNGIERLNKIDSRIIETGNKS